MAMYNLHNQLYLLTALIEYLTVLLEYLDLLQTRWQAFGRAWALPIVPLASLLYACAWPNYFCQNCDLLFLKLCQRIRLKPSFR